MMSSICQEVDDSFEVKQENDWEVVEYGPGEQETVSDPQDDPLNYVEANSTLTSGKDKSTLESIVKHENTEQETDTVSPYFMSEVTDDTTTEARGNNNEGTEAEAIIVVPEWSWEAMDGTDDNANDNTQEQENNRENSFVDIDYNGIVYSDSDSVDDDNDVDYGKRKKSKKSPDKIKIKKCKLTTSEDTMSVTKKLEVHDNPDDIYIPDGWTRRVFKRLTGKYPGKLDVTYIDSNGKKFKSKIDVIRYFAKNNINSEIDIESLCFGYRKVISKKLPTIETMKTLENHSKINDQEFTISKKISLIKKTIQKKSKIFNQEKYKDEISSQNSAVSTLCERMSVTDVTVEYSQEDFINLTNHQVYTEYISAMLEAENPEVQASEISEIAEAKWKQFLAIKESKTVKKEGKISQEIIEILQEDYEEPEDEADEDYKEDGAESNESHESDDNTNLRKVKKSVKCPCCMVICYSIDALGKHLKTHEEEQTYDIDDDPYGCPHCPEKFVSIEILFSHVETHGIILNNKEERSVFACIYCEKTCTTLINLKQHVNSHLKCTDKDGNVVMYNCPLCHNKFTKVIDIRTHIMNLHNLSEKFFKTQLGCPYCPIKCNSFKILNYHIKRKHTEDGITKPHPDKYKCIQCEYTTNRKERLVIHIRVHTGEKPFKCNLCDHATSSVSNLRLHMLIHNETKKYQCSFCDYKCNQRTSLKVHERMHTDDRPFLCSDCGHRCLTKNNLETHMKTHTEGSECACSICGMAFLHTNSLKSHMTNVHSTQSNSTKRISCPECNYMATTKGNLKVHMRVHTGERSHQCPECGKKFTQGGSLKIHIRKHTGEKPFGCRICSYRCTTKGNLLKHMIKHGGYTSKDIFEEKWEKSDNEDYSESNCKKILNDIMKSGNNLHVDQTVANEIQEDNQDVEIIDDMIEQNCSDITKNNLENLKKLNNSTDEDLPNIYKQTNYELGQANYCEPQHSCYNSLHQTTFSVENEGKQSHEKKAEDDEQHFLSRLFQ